jgi:hypothetical protein
VAKNKIEHQRALRPIKQSNIYFTSVAVKAQKKIKIIHALS